MPLLPVELFPEIISKLVTPPHPLQLGHNVTVLSTLRYLCLVNQYMRSLSTPYLYSSVVIFAEDQLQALLRTYNSSFTLCSHTSSLAVHYFPGNIGVIHCLFYLLGPYLRRLALFGITAIELGSCLIRDALEQHCSNLEQVVLLENNPEFLVHTASLQTPYPFFPEFKALRQLVLDDPFVDDAFIHYIVELPELTHLVLIDPRWPHELSTSQLFQASKSLKMITAILREVGQWYGTSLMKIAELLSTSGDLLDVRLVKLLEDDVYSKGRIQEWVCTGAVWELNH